MNEREKENARKQLIEVLQQGNDFRMKLRGHHKMIHSDDSNISGRQKEVDKDGFVILESNPYGRNPGDFWDITTQPFTSYSRDLEHFAVFPKELIIKPLKASCPSGGVVLDPFCGRGTVGRVAKELGLRYVLFDIKPEYVELAKLYVNGQKRKLIKNQGRLET